MRAWIAVATLLISMGLAACASTYSSKGAETLPADRIGILRHDYPFDSGYVIQEIDGRWRGVGVKTAYRLTPGIHSLGVIPHVPSFRGVKQVRWFEVKPGREYAVESAVDTDAVKWQFWIIDRATGQRVDFTR